MNAPKEFVSALRAFDPALRIRWAHRMEVWIIERKMEPRHKQLVAERPNPFKSARGWDLYDGWKEGYVHVLSVHPTLLDHRVFATLAEADAWRQGGMAKMAAQLDAADEAVERAEDRERLNVNEALSRDAYDRIAWLEGRRVAVTEPGEPAGERRDGYVVRDRRVTA